MKLMVAVLGTLMAACAAAAQWTFDEKAKTLSDGNWTLTATKDKDGNFTINRYKAGGGTLDFAAAAKDGCKVVAIGNEAFRVFRSVTTATVERVIAPDVERIGNLGFYNCDTMKSFEGGAKLTEIGRDAFNECHQLTGRLVFPLLKEVKGKAFRKTAITAIELPAVERLGEFAFQFCDRLETFVGAENVREFDVEVFYGCKGLKGELTFPLVTNVPRKVFLECGCKVNLPAAVSLGQMAFSGSPLERLSFPKVTTLGKNVFKNAQTEEIDLPCVTEFSLDQIAGCDQMKKINLKDRTIDFTLLLGEPFKDGVKLPTGKRFSIWGTAAPGARAEVFIYYNAYVTQADSNGNWEITVDFQPKRELDEDIIFNIGGARDGVFGGVAGGYHRIIKNVRFVDPKDADPAVMARATAPVEYTADNSEILVRDDAPVWTRFAAEELSRFLAKIFGREVPTVSKQTPGKKAFVVGEWPRSAAEYGTHRDWLKAGPDAFAIMSTPTYVQFAGFDSPETTPIKWDKIKWPIFAGTLSAVYEFLERYAGCRFYFTGELGTIVPKADKIVVPQVDDLVKPAYDDRTSEVMWEDFFPDELLEGEGGAGGARYLTGLRWKMSMRRPACHGQCNHFIYYRMTKSHPELFLQNASGSRDHRHCPSSQGVYDLIFERVREMCSKDSRTRRNRDAEIPSNPCFDWDGGRFIDLSLFDGMDKRCHCKDCEWYQKIPGSYLSDTVWRRTVDFAERLKREGLNDVRVYQLAYWPYQTPPEWMKSIPDNVDVFLCVEGVWGELDPKKAFEDDLVKKWCDLGGGRKVMLWNYSGKWGRKFWGLPSAAPRAYAAYYKRMAKYAKGFYIEDLMDNWLFSCLYRYVLMRVAWNLDADVDAILKEYHELMFGAAAAEMAELTDLYEKAFLSKRYGYTPGFIERCAKLYDAAAAKVAEGSLEARRIALFRKNFHDTIAAYVAKNYKYLWKRSGVQNGEDGWKYVEFSTKQDHLIDGVSVTWMSDGKKKAPPAAWRVDRAERLPSQADQFFYDWFAAPLKSAPVAEGPCRGEFKEPILSHRFRLYYRPQDGKTAEIDKVEVIE